MKQIAKDDANGSDLALLRAGMQNIETGEPLTFPICRLSARMPKKGTKVVGVGYARFEVASDVSRDDFREITD